MATRIEKIFRTNTICLMDSILNEINSLVENKQTNKSADRLNILVYKNIAKSICGFYKKNDITDAEIRIAITRGNKKCR